MFGQNPRPMQCPLNLKLDPRLPISAHAADIAAALASHSIIIVCGATGSGKSTQLPKLCLASGRAARGMIGHTQPRRIAARAKPVIVIKSGRSAAGGTEFRDSRFSAQRSSR